MNAGEQVIVKAEYSEDAPSSRLEFVMPELPVDTYVVTV